MISIVPDEIWPQIYASSFAQTQTLFPGLLNGLTLVKIVKIEHALRETATGPYSYRCSHSIFSRPIATILFTTESLSLGSRSFKMRVESCLFCLKSIITQWAQFKTIPSPIKSLLQVNTKKHSYDLISYCYGYLYSCMNHNIITR